MAFTFSITDSAHARLLDILSNQETGSFMRISVQGGGCSGFEYKFNIDTSTKTSDHHIGPDHAKVVIDQTSALYLNDSVLDFTNEIGSQKFIINNPNAGASCGCGNSFVPSDLPI